MKIKKTILVILAGGGHTAQLVKLLNLIGNKYNYKYVINEDDKTSLDKVNHNGQFYKFKRTKEVGEGMFVAILKQFFALYDAFNLINKSKCDVVLSAGSSISAPICFVARLLGKKVIFLESWSRVTKKSRTGKFIYLFANLFFVQHKEMLNVYPKAKYAGRLS